MMTRLIIYQSARVIFSVSYFCGNYTIKSVHNTFNNTVYTVRTTMYIVYWVSYLQSFVSILYISKTIAAQNEAALSY